MVCFAIYDFSIHLEDGMLLAVECEHEFGMQGLNALQRTDFPLAETHLPRIIDTVITSAEIENEGNLRLRFSNGNYLLLVLDERFESYRLVVDGKEFFAGPK